MVIQHPLDQSEPVSIVFHESKYLESILMSPELKIPPKEPQRLIIQSANSKQRRRKMARDGKEKDTTPEPTPGELFFDQFLKESNLTVSCTKCFKDISAQSGLDTDIVYYCEECDLMLETPKLNPINDLAINDSIQVPLNPDEVVVRDSKPPSNFANRIADLSPKCQE
jgi:hypothetical protein